MHAVSDPSAAQGYGLRFRGGWEPQHPPDMENDMHAVSDSDAATRHSAKTELANSSTKGRAFRHKTKQAFLANGCDTATLTEINPSTCLQLYTAW